MRCDGHASRAVLGQHLNQRPAHHCVDEEAIGYLTTPVDIPAWIAVVESRFAFLAHLTDEERAIARCNPGDRWQVQQLVDDIPTGWSA